MSKRLYFFPSFRQTEKSFNFEQLMPFAYSCQHWRHKSLDVYAKYLLSRSWLDSKAKSFTQTADSWWFTNTVTEFCPERKQVSPQYLVFFSFLTKLYNLSEFKRRSRRYNYFENSSCNLIGNSRNYSFLAVSAVSRRSDTVCQSYVWRRKFIKMIMNWNWITQRTYMTFLSSRLYFYAN